MTFLEAVKKSQIVRRPILKHLGSNGNGWIDARYAFDQGRGMQPPFQIIYLLEWNDLIATDWEAKVDV